MAHLSCENLPVAGTVSWISIAPVKGMRIQAIEEIDLTRQGAPGDRAFFLVDSKGAMVNGKRFGALMEIVPSHDPATGRLSLTFPERQVVEDQVELGQPEPVTFFGQHVRARPAGGPFSEAVSKHVGSEVRLMARPEGRPAVDRGKWGGVSLLGVASLNQLRSDGHEFNCAAAEVERSKAPGVDPDPGPIDYRRFRMTFGIEGTGPYEEDDWVSREIRVGDARVRVGGHTGRCAVTTRDPDSGTTDLKVLHFLRYSRNEVDSHEALPFGIYGEVIEPGTVRLGDQVSLL